MSDTLPFRSQEGRLPAAPATAGVGGDRGEEVGGEEEGEETGGRRGDRWSGCGRGGEVCQ